MTSACHATPWMRFIHGLAQVHNLRAAAQSRHMTSSGFSRCSTRCLTATRSFGTKAHQGQKPATPGPDAVGHVNLEFRTSAQNLMELDTLAVENAATAGQPKQDLMPTKKPRKTEQWTEAAHLRDNPSTSASPTKSWVNAKLASKVTGDKPTQLRPQKKPEVKESWRIQKEALKKKFPEGWAPRKRLSPDALAGIRALNSQFPDIYTAQALADKFEISPEAMRRILRTKWTPSVEEEQERQERWFRRGKQVWERKAAFGVKPPRKWRREGIVRDVEWHERRDRAVRLERDREESEKTEEIARRARERGTGGSWEGQ